MTDLKSIEKDSYDYFDFGCSEGGCMDFVKRWWPQYNGLGIDNAPKKIDAAVAKGHNAILGNILDLPDTKLTKFVMLSHFLEHLESMISATEMLNKAAIVAEDFIFIRQPYFDADGYLMDKKLKFFWSHWTGHKNRMSQLDFYIVFEKMMQMNIIQDFAIGARGPVKSSTDPCILPLTAPIDQHDYNFEKHGPKIKDLTFEVPLFKEIIAIAWINKASQLPTEIQEKLSQCTIRMTPQKL